MSIQRVGANSAEAATVTIPDHKVGDLIMIFAFRDGSATNPSIGAGFTNITNTTDGTSCSVSMGYRVATATNTTSGTWTNATTLLACVYRGQKSTGTPFGTIVAAAATTGTATYAATNLVNSNVAGSSWFLGFIGCRSIDTAAETPPAGMSLVTNITGASAESSAFDTNGPATGNWPATNVTLGGTNSGHVQVVVELKAEPGKLNNYQSVRVGDGMGTNERIA